VAYGRRGAITDDTQMTLFTAKALTANAPADRLPGAACDPSALAGHPGGARALRYRAARGSEFGFPGARHVLGVALAALAVAVAAGSLRRWHRVQCAMRREEDLPPTRMPMLLGAALVVLAALVGALLLISGPV
jgi:F0F1-type ATP synthase membrane subunit c/vacuolar-type H+-ATPase subunit K